MRQPLLLTSVLLCACACARGAAAGHEVPVEIRFGLVDASGAPIAGAPVRLAIASGAGWQRADAGALATTDAAGEARVNFSVVPETRSRKLPTNFTTQLLSPAQPTVHFAVAAQLPFLGRPWLYVHEADQFGRDTTAQLDAPRMYAADARGDFTEPASTRNGAWRLPGMELAVSSTGGAPGYRVARFSIAPDGAGWSVRLVLAREPEPVRR